MQTFSANLYARMQAELQDIERETDNPLQLAEESFNIVSSYLRDLKAFTLEYEFIDKEEEIHFFKEIKPMFLKEVIYFMKVFEIESSVPVGSGEPQKKYYHGITGQLNAFFEEYKFLHMYYRTNKTYLDETLFKREPDEFPLYPHYSLDEDPHFSNVYSYRLGKIQAFENILIYIQSKLHSLDNDNAANSLETKARSPLNFTGTKAQFIELGYSLQCAGVFNNGKADVKQVMSWLQFCFNIKVTHYYGYFQSMRIRKKNRTPFIDQLRDVVLRRMDESDENPRFH